MAASEGRRHRIGRAPGVVVEVLELGATVHRVEVADPGGGRRDVVVGLGSAAARLASTDYLGGTVGRVANRIAGGAFDLDGTTYELGRNEGATTLHGGPEGFDRARWTTIGAGPHHVELSLASPDGDQGFPGRLEVRARFETDGPVLRTTYTARASAPTPVSLTSHLYLSLDDTGTIDDHLLQVPADAYLPVDGALAPTGEVADVTGTPFDLREPRRLGDVLASEHPQLRRVGGLDHHLDVGGRGLRPLAALVAPATGLRAVLLADQPGLQVYSGLVPVDPDGHPGPVTGLALEPQHAPDSVHHPEWPDTVLRPGGTYRWRSELRFGTA